MIFGIKSFTQSDKYYFFEINGKGNLTLLKFGNGEYKNLILSSNKFIEKFNNIWKKYLYFLLNEIDYNFRIMHCKLLQKQ